MGLELLCFHLFSHWVQEHSRWCSDPCSLLALCLPVLTGAHKAKVQMRKLARLRAVTRLGGWLQVANLTQYFKCRTMFVSNINCY